MVSTDCTSMEKDIPISTNWFAQKQQQQQQQQNKNKTDLHMKSIYMGHSFIYKHRSERYVLRQLTFSLVQIPPQEVTTVTKLYISQRFE